MDRVNMDKMSMNAYYSISEIICENVNPIWV